VQGAKFRTILPPIPVSIWQPILVGPSSGCAMARANSASNARRASWRKIAGRSSSRLRTRPRPPPEHYRRATAVHSRGVRARPGVSCPDVRAGGPREADDDSLFRTGARADCETVCRMDRHFRRLVSDDLWPQGHHHAQDPAQRWGRRAFHPLRHSVAAAKERAPDRCYPSTCYSSRNVLFSRDFCRSVRKIPTALPPRSRCRNFRILRSLERLGYWTRCRGCDFSYR
jgi:hypothetical protein